MGVAMSPRRFRPRNRPETLALRFSYRSGASAIARSVAAWGSVDSTMLALRMTNT